MGLIVDGSKPFDRHVRVQLSGRQTRMTEEFLDHTKVRTTLQQMCRSRVPKPVRTHVGSPWNCSHGFVDHRTRLTLIEPAASNSEEQRSPGPIRTQRGSSVLQPAVQCRFCGQAVWHRPLLVPLAENTKQSSIGIDRLDVQPTQLADANSGGVQQFHDESVSQGERLLLLRTAFRRIHCVEGLALTQHRRQRPASGWSRQTCARVDGNASGLREPRSETTRRRSPSSYRRACRSHGVLGGQPRAHDSKVEAVEICILRTRGEMGQQCPRVTDVGPDRVFRPASAQSEVLGIRIEVNTQARRQCVSHEHTLARRD